MDPCFSESAYRMLFEHSMDGVLFSAPDGRIFAANPAACEMLGRSEEEICRLGRPGIIDMSDPVAIAAVAERALVGHARAELVFLRSDGTRIPTDVTSAIFQDANGEQRTATIVRNISGRKHAEAIAGRRSEVLLCIRHINEYLLTASGEQELYQFVCDSILGLHGTAGVWIGLKRPDLVIDPVASAGIKIATLQALDMKWEAESPRPAAQAIRTGKAVILDEIGPNIGGEHWRELLKKNGIASIVAAPIRLESEVLGVLGIWSNEAFAFDPESVDFICEVAGDIALGVRSIKMARKLAATLESLKQTLTGTVETIASLIEYRDPYTAGHERRVAEIARAIGQELGLTDKRVEGLRVIGYLHDVGKIAVPVEILSKPSRLSDIEFKLIQSHSEAGHEILKAMQFPWPVADTILQHHERLDGSGYPRGLKGEEIILEARIIAVADTVEAMATHRPYRPALGLDAALDEIVKGRGTRYDAAVVDACLRLFREKGFAPPA